MKRFIWLAIMCAGSATAVAIGDDQQPVPQSREMGGKKSVTTFFVTSRGAGRGATSEDSRAPTHIVKRSHRPKGLAIIPGVPI